jgi:molybdopterin molybdotransferase
VEGHGSACFTAETGLVPVPEVLARIEALLAGRPALSAETVPLAEGRGRILAATLTSPRDVPAFDNVAVDGWAFAGSGLAGEGPTRFRVMPGRAAAGHSLADPLPEGFAVQALTGAPMPAGADSVAMWEECRVEGDRVVVPAGFRAGSNRRRAGEDVRAGATVLEAGTRLRPQHLGVVAELGLDRIPVHRRLAVALLSSGDELLEPGTPFRAGCVFDANRTILAGFLAGLPCTVTDLGILPDDAARVRTVLHEAAACHDLVLSSAGASKGAEDHLASTVARDGELAFWQIALKPGRPFAAGRLGGAVYAGLPGNPVAAAVCFLLFVRPLILALAGAPLVWPRPVPVPSGFAFRKQPGRTELLRARLDAGAEGCPVVRRIPREGSGILTSLVEGDGLVLLPAERTRVEPGEPVGWLSFAELGAE